MSMSFMWIAISIAGVALALAFWMRSRRLGAEVRRLRSDLDTYRERRDVLEAVLTGMEEGVAVADKNGDFLFSNPAMERIFGFGTVDAPPDEWPDIYGTHHADTMEKVKADELILVKATQGIATEGREFFVRNQNRPEGAYLSGSAYPVHDEDGVVWGGALIARDITRRKLSEAERDELIADLEKRNAELERFTYTVSHDLKTPLVTVNGFVGLIERDLARKNYEQLKGHAQRIADATHTMNQLLADVLELSKVGRVVNPNEVFDLTDLAVEARDLVGAEFGDRKIEFVIAKDLPSIQGDRLRYLEVFQNLLDNACKFMGEQAAPRIEVGWRRDDDEPVCFVRDNGVGIDPAYHEKVFDLFDRLDTTVAGTGVGLTLVKRILEHHGSRIWIESDGAGSGSTFAFSLPTIVAENG